MRLSILPSLWCALFLTIANAEEIPYLADLAKKAPNYRGERVKIVGGFAVARRASEFGLQPHIDNILFSKPHLNHPVHNWVWQREGELGLDLNTFDNPIELSWHPMVSGQDIAPVLRGLRKNTGDLLIFRPAPIDVRMSFIDWGSIDTLIMRAPSAPITISNVPESDRVHRASTGKPGRSVSHHRMWHFPTRPGKIVQIGELGSENRITFTDASFDRNNPWKWTAGARWAVQRGNCRNPAFDQKSQDPTHESYYKNIRYYSKSGLIGFSVPLADDTPLSGDQANIAIHSNFKHVWGAAIFAESVIEPKSSAPSFKSNIQNYNAGERALNFHISGEYYDAGITFRAHGTSHPVSDLLLDNVVISDPFGQGTAYPGDGPPTARKNAGCSSIGRPSLDLGVFGTARGKVHFRYGGASLSGHLPRTLSGKTPGEPLHLIFENIGYSDEEKSRLTWDARKCCLPKIDGIANPAQAKLDGFGVPDINLRIAVEGKFARQRIHTPLAIEWGSDDANNVGLGAPINVLLENSMLHFMPAPPLIPPTHYPAAPNNRISLKTGHDKVKIIGNPWAVMYQNMTLKSGSALPYSLVLKGMIKKGSSEYVENSSLREAFIAESFSITNGHQLGHKKKGDAAAMIRLGLGNWAPPKFSWFKGEISFDNTDLNGEFRYAPAWDVNYWSVRIDKTLPSGTRFKLGRAQAFNHSGASNRFWYRNQIAQFDNASGESHKYYVAMKDRIKLTKKEIEAGGWRELENPFYSLRLYYLGELYRLRKQGAVINARGELVLLD